MADYQVLGLFDTAECSADAISGLRGLGIPDSRISVMSGFPYTAKMLNRRPHKSRLITITILGALLGFSTAAFFMAGIPALYSLDVGGQALVPIPPSVVIAFELTMLGTMWATFFGFLILNRFPNYSNQDLYNPIITEGRIGVLSRVPQNLVERAEAVMNSNNAVKVERSPAAPISYRNVVRFWGIFGTVVVVLAVVSLLFFYDVLKIYFPSQMINQESIAFQEGPRLAAPVAAVPVEGPVLINGEPASQPVPSSPASIQRGSIYFAINCLQCHGKTGEGNGTVGAFFTPTKPANLTSPQIQGLSDQQIFLVLTQGFGVMPPMYENLTPAARWDVVNYFRTLKK